MSRNRAKPRQSQSATDEDVFIAKTLEVTAWSKRNSGRVLMGSAIVLILSVIVWSQVRSAQNRQQLAVQELERAQQTIAMGDSEGAKIELGRFLEIYTDGVIAVEARLVLGELYLRSVEPAQAVAVLEPALSEIDEPIGIQAAILLGAAHEELGQWSEAERVYLLIADESSMDFQIREALGNAARIRETNDDLTGAAALYEQILDTFEDGDPSRGQYVMRLAEVRARM